MNDVKRIELLGGVNAIAKHLGMDYQRVFNWTKRQKIPAQVKLDYPHLFQSNNPPNLNKKTPSGN